MWQIIQADSYIGISVKLNSMLLYHSNRPICQYQSNWTICVKLNHMLQNQSNWHLCSIINQTDPYISISIKLDCMWQIQSNWPISVKLNHILQYQSNWHVCCIISQIGLWVAKSIKLTGISISVKLDCK